jgi:NAD(P)-dependent dehydrogenase (short-subunit alcohol dehydrogenase family)
MSLALVTGASRGLGLAVSRELIGRGWHVIIDARDAETLQAAAGTLGSPEVVTALPGDVSDEHHRFDLFQCAQEKGGLDLLINNASTLGASPLPGLADYPLNELIHTLQVNTLAPLGLSQTLLPLLIEREGAIVNVTSDAAVEAYAGWGGYGASKAALDQISAVLAVEHPGLRVYAFDPGDMRTDMHQEAYPGEDISDRPPPQSVVPSLLRLIDERPPSGRYRASDLPAVLESKS